MGSFPNLVCSGEGQMHASRREGSCQIDPQEREGVCVRFLWLDRSIMVLAANIAPMDVISHIPILCEEKGIPYIFVSSKVVIASEW